MNGSFNRVNDKVNLTGVKKKMILFGATGAKEARFRSRNEVRIAAKPSICVFEAASRLQNHYRGRRAGGFPEAGQCGFDNHAAAAREVRANFSVHDITTSAMDQPRCIARLSKHVAEDISQAEPRQIAKASPLVQKSTGNPQS